MSPNEAVDRGADLLAGPTVMAATDPRPARDGIAPIPAG